MKKNGWCAICMVLAVMAGLCFAVSGATAAGPKKDIGMTSYGVGSASFIVSAAIAEAVDKVAGIRTRVIPAGNDMGRMLPLKIGEVDLTIVTGGTGWIVSHGVFDFAAPNWGPQPLRMAWRGSNIFEAAYTRANSGIKKLSELKGKRVAVVPGAPTVNGLTEGYLAFGGLTLKDCKVSTFPSHGEAGKALTEGFIDFYHFGTTSARPVETAGSVHGIHWFDMDPDDGAAWERFYARAPWAAKAFVTRFAGKEKGIKPFWSCAYPYNLWAWQTTPIDTVYAYAKAIWEGYDHYKDKHPELPHWSHEMAVDVTACHYPYHDGVIKLLKEKGVWTPELEKFQKTQLENEAKRMALWNSSREKAKEQKIDIGSEAWKDFWWNQLVAANLLK